MSKESFVKLEWFKQIDEKTLQNLPNEILIVLIKELMNYVQELIDSNEDLRKENQELKDEINKLKGEKGKPDIKANKGKDEDNVTGNDENRNRGHRQRSRKMNIPIHRTERLRLDREKLPMDAEYKGTREVVIQDIKIELDNVKFEIERYYSESLGKYIEGELPDAYKGHEFGPGIRSFVLMQHFQGRVSQNRIHKILTDMGVDISEGQVSNIINSGHEEFHKEKEEARQAGIRKSSYQHVDDTGTRINGENGFTIATSNDYFCSYTTSFKKDRLSVINALTGAQGLKFLVDEIAIEYMKSKITASNMVNEIAKHKSEIIYDEEGFLKKIYEILPNVSLRHVKYILEGGAIAAYRRELMGPASKILVCDDAAQFKAIIIIIALCWVHEIRHYKKLIPISKLHKESLEKFMDKLWHYYEQLVEYKKKPDELSKKDLIDKFDNLFGTSTDYYAVNNRAKKTMKHKKYLLTVLDYPDVPLHNNTVETDIREKKIKMKISFCHRSKNGIKSSDTFLSLMHTCRKNGISFWRYLKDRIYKLFQIPPLSEIIDTS